MLHSIPSVGQEPSNTAAAPGRQRQHSEGVPSCWAIDGNTLAGQPVQGCLALPVSAWPLSPTLDEHCRSAAPAMNPLLTPLPASLSAEITAASAEQASGMAAEQAQQMSDMAVVPPLRPPTLPQAVLCVSARGGARSQHGAAMRAA